MFDGGDKSNKKRLLLHLSGLNAGVTDDFMHMAFFHSIKFFNVLRVN